MNVFYKIQKILLYIVMVLSIILLLNAIVEGHAIGIVMVFTAMTFLSGIMVMKIKKEDDE